MYVTDPKSQESGALYKLYSKYPIHYNLEPSASQTELQKMSRDPKLHIKLVQYILKKGYFLK